MRNIRAEMFEWIIQLINYYFCSLSLLPSIMTLYFVYCTFFFIISSVFLFLSCVYIYLKVQSFGFSSLPVFFLYFYLFYFILYSMGLCGVATCSSDDDNDNIDDDDDDIGIFVSIPSSIPPPSTIHDSC